MFLSSSRDSCRKLMSFKQAAVGMSALFIAKNPAIFPDPESFLPERWTGESAKTEHLERYLLAFGKGTRSCVGINLAYAELYTILATIFRRFPSLELYNTTERDVEHVHDYFSGMTRRDTEGLQVKIG
jgi:cytochrome P450